MSKRKKHDCEFTPNFQEAVKNGIILEKGESPYELLIDFELNYIASHKSLIRKPKLSTWMTYCPFCGAKI